MNVLFVAGFAVISSMPSQDIRLFVDTLGLPLRPPTSVPDSEYRYSEGIEGTKHFGVWPLSEAAHACFGTEPWGQVIARFQSADGVLLGVCSTPHLADA